MIPRYRAWGALALGALVLACLSNPADPADPDPDPTGDQAEIALLVGDIARCSNGGDEITADQVDGQSGTIFALGDMLQEHGASISYQSCYQPSWGRHLSRTWVAMGNHDYDENGGADAFDYFGARAGPPGLGYYSLDLGSWHVIVLNSNPAFVPTAPGSAQEQWLRADLAAHAGAKCVLAIWHHPRFYQGGPGHLNTSVKPFWDALYQAGADLVVNGHFHLYERYAPQDPAGNPDPRGMRQFIVGTGGGLHDVMHAPSPNVEARKDAVTGILKLTLRPGGYDWEFLAAAPQHFADAGSASCN